MAATTIELPEAQLPEAQAPDQHPTAADIDSVLQSLDASLPDPSDGESSSDEERTKPRRLNSMMGGFGRIVSEGPWQTSFYGPYSGYSFVMRTLELFRRVPDNAALALETHKVTSGLFSAPVPDAVVATQHSTHFQTLPTLAITLDLLDVVFSRCHPMIQFLHEADFRDMVHRLYSESARRFGASSHDFMPLFHAVLAIGLLFDVESRRKHGCEDIVNEA